MAQKKGFFHFIRGFLIGIVILLALFFILGTFLVSPLIKASVAVAGPQILGTEMSVADVDFSLFSGEVGVSKIVVKNPKGFSDNNAFSVGDIHVAVDLTSLSSDTVVIKNIEIQSPAIRYEKGDEISNFEAIMNHLSSLDNSARTGGRGESAEGKPVSDTPNKKKVVIDRLSITGAKVTFAGGARSGLTLPLPPIVLTDIGRNSSGITLAEVGKEVVGSLQMGVSQIGQITQDTAERVKEAGKSVKDAFKQVDKESKDLKKSLKDIFR